MISYTSRVLIRPFITAYIIYILHIKQISDDFIQQENCILQAFSQSTRDQECLSHGNKLNANNINGPVISLTLRVSSVQIKTITLAGLTAAYYSHGANCRIDPT